MIKLSSFMMLSFRDAKLSSCAAVEPSLVVVVAEQSLVVAAAELSLVVATMELSAVVVKATQVIAVMVVATKVVAVVVAAINVVALVVAAFFALLHVINWIAVFIIFYSSCGCATAYQDCARPKHFLVRPIIIVIVLAPVLIYALKMTRASFFSQPAKCYAPFLVSCF
jgi:hypothetical protein